ncbi:hypothetical protein H0H93_013132 [Arthromyces matolae]|nr:hypothetical protein H0H93_013132 [Arthromyces matolae]
MHEWDASTMKGASEYKWHFITNNSEGTTIRLESVRPKCRIILPLIDSLSDLFCQGHVGRCSRRRPKDWDHNTLGGLITFKTFLKALGHADEAIMTPVIDGFPEVTKYWPLLAIVSSRHHQPILRTSSLTTDTSASAAMKFENPCRTLWEAPNVEAFMDIFMDCVECHYHAYQKERMPHLELRESSLMFKYGPNSNVRGVLNDWDIASDVDNSVKSQLLNTTRCTGTIPFMARDLLVGGTPPPHLYRHDLESFFYIFVWAAINRDFGALEPRKTDFTTAQWDTPTLAHAKRIKQGFMSDYDDMKTEILERVHPKNSVLLPRIDALWLLFFQAHLDRGTRSAKLSVEDWDHTTLGGHITFEKFMKAIGREPR